MIETYIGTKVIQATPMNRQDYNTERGWQVPPNENPLDEGYLVRSQEGHVNWLPTEVFNSQYRHVGNQVELKHDLLTTKHTMVLHEQHYTNNAPHHFDVYSGSGELVGHVNFQEGPIKEAGVNGVNNEDLIAMVICRLEHFQQSPFSSRDNAMAITKLEEALLWLRKRTIGRENRGVEGTNTI